MPQWSWKGRYPFNILISFPLDIYLPARFLSHHPSHKRPCQVQESESQSQATCKNTEVSTSGATATVTSLYVFKSFLPCPPVKSKALLFPLLSLMGWQVSKRTVSRFCCPEKPWLHKVLLIAILTDYLFHMQRRKEKRSPGDLPALQQSDIACGYGAGLLCGRHCTKALNMQFLFDCHSSLHKHLADKKL